MACQCKLGIISQLLRGSLSVGCLSTPSQKRAIVAQNALALIRPQSHRTLQMKCRLGRLLICLLACVAMVDSHGGPGEKIREMLRGCFVLVGTQGEQPAPLLVQGLYGQMSLIRLSRQVRSRLTSTKGKPSPQSFGVLSHFVARARAVLQQACCPARQVKLAQNKVSPHSANVVQPRIRSRSKA